MFLIFGSVSLLSHSFSASYTPSSFKGARVWFHHSGMGRGVQLQKNWKTKQSKRNMGSLRKHKLGMSSLLGFEHPMMFNRETRLPSFHSDLRGSRLIQGRDKRGEFAQGVWIIQDCMTVSSKEEGIWEYRSDGRTETCGLYLVTKPDHVVEVTVHEA